MSLTRIRNRLIRELGVSLLLGVAAQAQTNSIAQKELPPLDLKLTTTSMMLCLGAELPLNLELANRGTDPIKLDRFDIWNSFQYGYFGERDAGRGGGQGSGCDHCRADSIFLLRDRPYESSFRFPLNTDFFKDAGKYSINLTIEGVASNKVEFELYNCN